MVIAVGGDHGGFELKNTVLASLKQARHNVVHFGAFGLDRADDYPDFTQAVGQAVQNGKAERAILICGSGVGASIAANKMTGIRAALCHDTFSAHQGVEDDDMNILCLGGRVIGASLAMEIIHAFLDARFSGLERHVRRVAKVAAMEAEGCRNFFQ